MKEESIENQFYSPDYNSNMSIISDLSQGGDYMVLEQRNQSMRKVEDRKINLTY